MIERVDSMFNLDSRISYENDASASYLNYKMLKEEELDRVGLGMLQNNNIEGIVPITFSQFNLDRKLVFNISAQVTLEDMLERPIYRKKLLTIFSCMVKTLLSANEYLLELNEFVFNTQYIFCDVSEGTAKFMYLPVVNDEKPNLHDFFQKIMLRVQLDEQEDKQYYYEIMQYLAKADFNLGSFDELIDTLRKQEVSNKKVISDVHTNGQADYLYEQPSITEPAVQHTVAQPVVKEVEAVKQEKPAKKGSFFDIFKPKKKEVETKNSFFTPAEKKAEAPVAKENYAFDIPGIDKPATSHATSFAVPNEKPAEPVATPVAPVAKTEVASGVPSFNTVAVNQNMHGETVDLQHAIGGGAANGETTVLSQAMQEEMMINPRLIRVKNNDIIRLDKKSLRLGKEKSYVDYFIGDNTAISRSHADFIVENGHYYVVDKNSTNHTYVNDEMITSNIKVEIKDGDVIRLANEKFAFKTR